MRYVIIPLLIVGLLYWIFTSIKDIIVVYKKEGDSDDLKERTHIFIETIFISIFLGLLFLTAKYW